MGRSPSSCRHSVTATSFALQTAVHILSTSTLEPITQRFEIMKKHIQLEAAGAQDFRNAWPLASIDRVLTVFHDANLASFDYQI